jgi:hypothetical protein
MQARASSAGLEFGRFLPITGSFIHSQRLGRNSEEEEEDDDALHFLIISRRFVRKTCRAISQLANRVRSAGMRTPFHGLREVVITKRLSRSWGQEQYTTILLCALSCSCLLVFVGSTSKFAPTPSLTKAKAA